MSDFEFTKEGLTIQTLNEIKSEVETALKAVYGSDINLDSDTPDGQRVGIYAKHFSDLQEFIAALYTRLDPDLSFGTFFDVILKYCGITRKPGTRSTVSLTIITNQACTLPAGFTVADDSGQNWITEDEIELVSGTNEDIPFVSENYGAYEASSDTITETVDVVLGVTSFTNPEAATAGLDEESEEDIRIRRNNSLENAAYSIIGSLTAKLWALDNVTDVKVYENDSDEYDSDKALMAHTIWPVIEGGADADIAEIIAKNKTGGTGLKGDELVDYVESFENKNGDTIEITHNMKFDRPTEIPLYIQLTATRTGSTAVDTDLIVSTLVDDADFSIEEYAHAAKGYSVAYEAGTNFVLSDFEISIDGETWTDEYLNPGYGAKFVLSSDNITVTEVS